MTDLSRRLARWVGLAAAISTAWACDTRPLVTPIPAPSSSVHDIYQRAITRKLDVLFMIDDSTSMAPLQNKLTASFPAFMQVLEGLPTGLPDVHIGVVSSSMGAGRNPDIAQCPPGGDRGVLQNLPRGATCARASLAAGQHFISNVAGIPNYTGDIADVFSCIAPLGDTGCGFEHQFASVLRALGADGQPAPPGNVGFLRADAFLLVILITNEDDCSAPPDSALFDSSSELVSDPLGPLQSYRCNEFGHLCGGQPPPRTPSGPTDLSGTCVSAEDGRLLRVADVVAALKNLKPNDPQKVLVAAITGPANPYVVDLTAPELPDPHLWPVIDHSCTTKEPDGSVTFGDPSVRIQQWVSAFGENGVFESICGDTFKAALTDIANSEIDGLTPCVNGKVLDTTGAPWTGTTTPDCTVIDHAPNDQNVIVDTALPACAPRQTSGPIPCWYLTLEPNVCAGGPLIHFNRPGQTASSSLDSSVACSVLTCPVAGAPGVSPPGCAERL